MVWKLLDCTSSRIEIPLCIFPHVRFPLVSELATNRRMENPASQAGLRQLRSDLRFLLSAKCNLEPGKVASTSRISPSSSRLIGSSSVGSIHRCSLLLHKFEHPSYSSFARHRLKKLLRRRCNSTSLIRRDIFHESIIASTSVRARGKRSFPRFFSSNFCLSNRKGPVSFRMLENVPPSRRKGRNTVGRGTDTNGIHGIPGPLMRPMINRWQYFKR